MTESLSDKNEKIFQEMKKENKGFDPLWVFLRMEDNQKESIKELLDYQDLKIKLGKESEHLNKEERAIHINCCIDTKMSIKKIFGSKLTDNSQQSEVKENDNPSQDEGGTYPVSVGKLAKKPSADDKPKGCGNEEFSALFYCGQHDDMGKLVLCPSCQDKKPTVSSKKNKLGLTKKTIKGFGELINAFDKSQNKKATCICGHEKERHHKFKSIGLNLKNECKVCLCKKFQEDFK